jgi:cell division protein FtsQ
MRGMLSLRIVAWGIALTLVALPLVGVFNGWFAAERWPLRTLQIEAEFGHLSVEQIRAAAAGEFGKGFFALDLAALQHSVAELPWVERVEARKRWPDAVVLRVYEQQPFAHWGDKRLIGRDGRLFEVPGADAIGGLPQLSGPDERLHDVIAFHAAVQKQLVGSGLAVVRVTLSERGSWTLGLDGGAKIVLGTGDDAAARLARFIQVYPRLAASHAGTGFELADLRYTNGFAMHWPPSPAPTPAPAGAPTPAPATPIVPAPTPQPDATPAEEAHA